MLSVSIFIPKNYALVLCGLGLAWTMSACSSAEKEHTTPQSQTFTQPTADVRNRHILVFIDKTLSSTDETAFQTHREALRKWLADSLQNNGDALAAWPVNANTGGDAPFVNDKLNVPLPNNEGVGRQTAEDNQAEFESNLRKQKADFLDKIDAAFAQHNTEQTNLQTDLWRSLEAASRYLAGAPARDGRYVIWVSDMVESMKGTERRDFHLNKITDRQQAEQLAAADVQYIEQTFKVDKKVLASTQFRILFPAQPNQQTQNNVMRYYWEKVLTSLGVPEQNIRYEL
ncbi:hypothetical protein SAMN05421780_102226 [Flexibacter flexilis DSM 6793]|uniref:VWFA domain-containing protein n=1 Tax=Flexibacter flexilis DSM 6793 TaxID=927664 RepID=A0A1I1FK78_9BACT|nr:hypothetical protein [Flexibacter flexilis]SFB99817.1 hypothetical protein SAMN05421780_102226 [Flexibacter flexilis DSM 6793]